jgi:hypothetical protein
MPEHRSGDTELLVAECALFAVAAGDQVVETGPVSRLHPGYVRTDGLHDTGHLMSENERKRLRSRRARAIVRIGVTDACRVDPDEHVPSPDRGDGYIVHLHGSPHRGET